MPHRFWIVFQSLWMFLFLSPRYSGSRWLRYRTQHVADPYDFLFYLNLFSIPKSKTYWPLRRKASITVILPQARKRKTSFMQGCFLMGFCFFSELLTRITYFSAKIALIRFAVVVKTSSVFVLCESSEHGVASKPTIPDNYWNKVCFEWCRYSYGKAASDN